MSVVEYRDLLERAAHLDSVMQRRLLADLAALVRDPVPARQRYSLMELEGLGQEVWAGADAQEYVNRERDAWNG